MQWKSFNSLFTKIFSAFGMLIALLISALILLPQLDGRQLQPISTRDLNHLKQPIYKLTQLIEKNPILSSQSLLLLLSKNTDKEIYLTELSGRLINSRAPRKMRQFILDSQSPKLPRKRVNNYKTYLGPVKIEHKHKELLMYVSIKNKKKSLELVEWLLDNPLLLLLTALITSAPICAFFACILHSPYANYETYQPKLHRVTLTSIFRS